MTFSPTALGNDRLLLHQTMAEGVRHETGTRLNNVARFRPRNLPVKDVTVMFVRSCNVVTMSVARWMGRVNTAGNPESLRSDGPHNEVIESQFPSQMDPPATDISTQRFFWSSFNISPKRIQNGG
jgi:hypothetical protein